MFAYCSESGMEPELRHRVLEDLKHHSLTVSTSVTASSTGYPFKVVDEIGTIADPAVYAARVRRCDMGYLREAYLDENGATAYRCAAEPLNIYRRKGGHVEDVLSTMCLCNGLMATCGLAQVRPNGYVEPALVTSGDRIEDVTVMLDGRDDFSAQDVIDWLNPTSDPCNVESLVAPVNATSTP
jgi:NAD(P)H-dependent flavin oxidoreductase YrpB (nitropropane dioxygenase family)